MDPDSDDDYVKKRPSHKEERKQEEKFAPRTGSLGQALVKEKEVVAKVASREVEDSDDDSEVADLF